MNLRLFLYPALFFFLFLGLAFQSNALAAHGQGSSWVENANLAGCEHCHDTVIEWDTGETRQIANRDENISVRGGRSGQTHMIVNMNVDSGRVTDTASCNQVSQVCDPNSEVSSLWNDVVNYMTEKEPVPLPYNELNAKTYLMNCYDDVPGSAYISCPSGPGTLDDNCNCFPVEPTTSTTSTTSTTISTTPPTSSTTSSTTSTVPPTSSTSTTSTSTSTTSTTSTTTDGSPPRPCDLRCQIRLSITRPTVVRPPRPTIVRPSGTVTTTPTTTTSTTSTTVVP